MTWSHSINSEVNELILSCLSMFNPLRAKFFIVNINMYLPFMSFLHIDMTQELKILPGVRPGPTYTT